MYDSGGYGLLENIDVDEIIFDDGSLALTTRTLLLLLILLDDGVTSHTMAVGTACWKNVDEEDVNVDEVVDDGISKMTSSESTTRMLLLLVLLLMLLGGGVTSHAMVAGMACWKKVNVDIEEAVIDGISGMTGSASTTRTLLLLLLFL